MICINALSAYERKFCVFMTILMLIHVFWFHRLAVHQKFNHYFYPKLCREEDINSIHPTISFIISCLYKNMSRQNLVLPCQNNPTKKDTCLTGFINMCHSYLFCHFNNTCNRFGWYWNRIFVVSTAKPVNDAFVLTEFSVV